MERAAVSVVGAVSMFENGSRVADPASEEIGLVDLKELVSTRFLSERVVPKKRAPISRRVKRSRTYGKKHAPLAPAIRRNLALSIFSLASIMLAGEREEGGDRKRF